MKTDERLRKAEFDAKVERGMLFNLDHYMLGDMNAKVRDEKVESIVRGWGVQRVKANCEFLVQLWAERVMFLANTYFKYKLIHRYTWTRDGVGNEQKALTDYEVTYARIRKEDAKIVRGMLKTFTCG